MPSALLLPRIFKICGTLTNMEPTIIPIPSPLLSVALKQGTKIIIESSISCDGLKKCFVYNCFITSQLTVKQIILIEIFIVTLFR